MSPRLLSPTHTAKPCLATSLSKPVLNGGATNARACPFCVFTTTAEPKELHAQQRRDTGAQRVPARTTVNIGMRRIRVTNGSSAWMPPLYEMIRKDVNRYEYPRRLREDGTMVLCRMPSKN